MCVCVCVCVCVLCVFVPVLWSLSSREIGAALRRRWPSSHPSFHLPLYLSLPPLPLSSATVSCLISPLLPLTQMLRKQLPCISMHLCCESPFSAKAACVYIRMQAAHQRCSVSFDNNLGPRGAVAPDTLSHSSSSANTDHRCQ